MADNQSCEVTHVVVQSALECCLKRLPTEVVAGLREQGMLRVLIDRSRLLHCLQQRYGHTASVLDGKKISSQWQADLLGRAADVTTGLGRPPGLGVVLVGSRPDSRIYVQRKQEACAKVGIKVVHQTLPDTVSQADVESAVKATCDDQSIDGILVQLPLPKHLDDQAVIHAVDPKKDVDGFHPHHRQQLEDKQQPHFLPCTALGVMELIKRSGISLHGKSAVVIGNSGIVGTPLAMLLQANGVAALTVCPRSSYPEAFAAQGSKDSDARAEAGACVPPVPEDVDAFKRKHASWQRSLSETQQDTALAAERHTKQDQPTGLLDPTDEPPPACSASMKDLPAIARTADILVVAVGHAELVKRSWVKPGAVVIDVGINVVGNVDNGDYHVVGDAAYSEVAQVASAITPVPGGVGPMTIAAVLQNTIQAAETHLLNREHK